MKALVVGGGIGGLSAGIALSRAGFEVDVFERANEIREIGAGLSLWSNAIHALGQLGLADVIRSVGLQNPPAGLRSWNGALLTPALPVDLAYRLQDLCVVMHRAELLAALLQALGEQRVRLGARAVGFEQRAGGVAVQFADGASAGGDVLIGADGLSSVVRAGLHGQRRPTYSGYTSWRAVVRFRTSRVQPTESWGYGTRFGQVPMSGDRVYWYAALNVPEGGRNADEKAVLEQTFRGWHTPIEALIDATDASAILRNDIYDRPVLKTWGAGCVTLLGDAAHPMTPNLGQGACQAIEDAVVLGKCLGRQRYVASALRAYEGLRIPRANRIVTRSRQIGRLGQWQQPLAVALRTALLRHVSPRLQVKSLERLVGYRV